MNLPPQTIAGKEALKEATNLYKSLNHRIGDFKALRELSARYKELESLKRGVSAVTERIKTIDTKINKFQKITNLLNTDVSKLNQKYKPLENIAKQAKGITDKLQKGLFKQINPKLGGSVSAFGMLVSTGITLLAIKSQEEIQEIDLRKETVKEVEFSNAWTRLINNSIKIRNIEKQIKAYKDAVDRNYAEAASAARNATYAREKANEALYETRIGRAKLESAIAEIKKITINAISVLNLTYKKLEASVITTKKNTNDALHETRAGRAKLEASIATAKKDANDALYEARSSRVKLEAEIQSKLSQNKQALDNINKQYQNKFEQLQNQFKEVIKNSNAGFQEKIQTTIADIQKGLQETKIKINNNESKIIKATSQISDITKKITEVPQLIERIINPLSIKIDKNIVDLGDLRITFENAIKETNKETTQIKKEQAKIDSVVGHQGKTFEQSAKEFQAQAQQQRSKLDEFKEVIFEREISSNSSKQNLDKLKIETDKIKTDLEKLRTDVNKQEKMNEQGLAKLDKMLPLITQIPFIAGNTAQHIKPLIPTNADLERAAAKGTCQTYQPGGCSNNALNNLGNNINGNTNNAANNILDGINTTQNAAQLALLTTIDNKIGAQLPGGLSGTFGRLWKLLQIDRIINILILINTFHNAAMLSNNIAQTLFGAIDNLAQSAGFKWKNEKGEEEGIGGLMNEWTTNFFKSIFGEENYKNLNTAFNAASKIYQSATNMLWSVQSMFDSARSIAELTAGNTGKIGNALKRAGAVYENAYAYMSERIAGRTATQAKFDTAIENLQQIEQGVSAFSTITSEIVSIGDNFNELKEQRKEFDKAKEKGEKAVETLVTNEKEASKLNKDISINDVSRNDD